MRALLAAVLLLLGHAALVPATLAQTTGDDTTTAGDAYSGALKTIHDRGSVIIGYRPSAFPFSYTLNGHPIGYSIDLCLGVVEQLEQAVDRPLRVDYVPLTADARLDAVTSHQVDLECSSTTANAERQQLAAFSPIIFVAGTKLLVKRDSRVRSFRDLDGRTVAVNRGTTNEQVIVRLVARGRIAARVVAAPDLDAALAMVRDGQADAMASDDVLLYGLIARAQAADQLMVVGDFLSYEPYGIMYAKGDPALTDAVDRAFAAMAQDRDLVEFYDRWFERPTPGGETMNMPISAQLAEVFRLLGLEE